MRSRKLSSLLVMFLTFGAAATASAVHRIATWDNSFFFNWNSAHWSTANFPNNGGGDTYDAIVNSGEVTLNLDITIEKFNLNNLGPASRFRGTSGTTLTVKDLFTWTGGVIDGEGNIIAEGGLNINVVEVSLNDNRVLTIANTGIANFSAGQINVNNSSNAILDNNGMFNVSGNAGITGIGGISGTRMFSNDGTFNKSGGTTSIGIPFNNTGTVNVDSGTLLLTAPGGASSGEFAADEGATLNFTSYYSVGPNMLPNGGAAISGAGTVRFSGATTDIGGTYNVTGSTNISGGTANFNGAATATSVFLTSPGILSGSGALAVTNFTWTNGAMEGTGSTTVGGILTINGVEEYLQGSRVLTNNGTATLSGSKILVYSNAILDNNGTFNVTGNSSIVLQIGTGSVSNDGKFNKSGDNTTTEIRIPFNNTDTVNVNSGTLSLTGGVTQLPGATLTGGTWNVFANSTLDITTGSNITVNQGNVKLSGGGSTFAKINSINNNQGSFTVENGRNFTTAGALANSGTVTAGANNSTLTVAGAYTQSAGTTVLAGGTLTSTSNTISIAGGSLTGSGTLNGNVAVSSPASITIENGNNITNIGKLTNVGTVTIGAGSTLTVTDDYTQSASGGTTVLAGGTLTSTANIVNITGGSLTGTGTLNGNVVVGAATIAPGASVGAITVGGSGNLTLGSGSSFAVELGGTTPGTQYDTLAVGGTAALAGNLNFSFINSFGLSTTPATAFTVLTAGSLTGAFANGANGQRLLSSNGLTSFVVHYDNNSVVLDNFDRSADAIWTGTTGNWTTAANWNLNPYFPHNGQPTIEQLFDVTIDTGTANATLDSAITINRLALSAGALTGGANLTTNDVLTWTGGTMSGTGMTDATAGLTISGAASKTLSARTLHNGAIANLSGGNVTAHYGATVVNDGTFSVTDGADIVQGFGATATFQNNGAFNKSGAATLTTIGTAFNNMGAVNVNSGTLTVAGAYTQSAGTTALAGGAFTTSGLLTWTGGTLSGSGTMNATAGLAISGVAGKTLSAGTLHNGAIANLSGGNVTAADGATLLNNGTFNVTDGAGIAQGTGAAATFQNNGTFNKSGAATTIGIAFNNSGTVNVDGGTLLLTGGGASSGAFAVDANTTLTFDGAHTLSAASAISGAGTVNVAGTFTRAVGTTNFSGVTTNLTGTLNGAGSVKFNTGQLNWTGGIMEGTGSTIIGAAAQLDITGPSIKTLSGSRVLANSGTEMNFHGGTLFVSSSGSAAPGAVLNNNGFFEVTDAADISLNDIGGGQPSFNNTQVFNKRGVGTTTNVGIAFNNTGAVHVNSGTLQLSGGVTQLWGSTLTSGLWTVSISSTLDFSTGSNITTNQANVTLEGVNSTFAKINSLADNQGSFTIDLGRNFTTAGALANSGNLTVGSNSTLTIGANFNNTGTLRAFGGTVHLSGGVTQHTGNTLTGGTWYVGGLGSSTLNISSGSNITTNQANVTLFTTGSTFAKFDSLADNQGSFTIDQGRNFTTVGSLTNSGTITVGTGSVLTVTDDYTQLQGETHVKGTITIPTTKSLIVAGGVIKGAGKIISRVTNKGKLAPGSSPGLLTIEGDFTQEDDGELLIELAGTTAESEYDQLVVTGHATLDGTLTVSLLDLFSPAAGNTFHILDWDSVSGTFATLHLPPLAGPLAWKTSQLYTAGVLSVVFPGDYNTDGTVDAADYILWRKSNNTATTLPNDSTPGTDQSDYNVWRAHFGQSAGSGSSTAANAAVPEPSTLVMLVLAAAGVCSRRRRAA